MFEQKNLDKPIAPLYFKADTDAKAANLLKGIIASDMFEQKRFDTPIAPLYLETDTHAKGIIASDMFEQKRFDTPIAPLYFKADTDAKAANLLKGIIASDMFEQKRFDTPIAPLYLETDTDAKTRNMGPPSKNVLPLDQVDEKFDSKLQSMVHIDSDRKSNCKTTGVELNEKVCGSISTEELTIRDQSNDRHSFRVEISPADLIISYTFRFKGDNKINGELSLANLKLSTSYEFERGKIGVSKTPFGLGMEAEYHHQSGAEFKLSLENYDSVDFFFKSCKGNSVTLKMSLAELKNEVEISLLSGWMLNVGISDGLMFYRITINEEVKQCIHKMCAMVEKIYDDENNSLTKLLNRILDHQGGQCKNSLKKLLKCLVEQMETYAFKMLPNCVKLESFRFKLFFTLCGSISIHAPKIYKELKDVIDSECGAQTIDDYDPIIFCLVYLLGLDVRVEIPKKEISDWMKQLNEYVMDASDDRETNDFYKGFKKFCDEMKTPQKIGVLDGLNILDCFTHKTETTSVSSGNESSCTISEQGTHNKKALKDLDLKTVIDYVSNCEQGKASPKETNFQTSASDLLTDVSVENNQSISTSTSDLPKIVGK